jgi:hypothetical protein
VKIIKSISDIAHHPEKYLTDANKNFYFQYLSKQKALY